jgi:hypothetical protein
LSVWKKSYCGKIIFHSFDIEKSKLNIVLFVPGVSYATTAHPTPAITGVFNLTPLF